MLVSLGISNWRLVLALFYLLTILQLKVDVDCITVEDVWRNPSLLNYSSKDIVFTVKNRCSFYPRCILFDCCSHEMKRTVNDYFNKATSHLNKNNGLIKHHFLHSSCVDDPLSFNERISSIPLRQYDVLNLSIIQDGIVELPPTHPHAYKIRENCCNFRVLYLVQGDNIENLSPAYSQMKDMIFINFRKKENRNNTLYFPGSSFLTGRMALYLAARQLEISQGWLYDYFVFTDDDVGVDSGGYPLFEQFLEQWRPALAAPSLKKYPDRLFQAIIHMDLMVWAYHREAVEVLLPLIEDFDENCLWSSNLIANMETSYIYRNHMVSTSIMHIWGAQHRSYKRDADSVFPLVLSDFKSVVKPNLGHCVPQSVDIHTLSYYQGMKGGVIRPKMGSYHLMDVDFNKLVEEEKTICPELVFNGETIGRYYNCCTIDNVLASQARLNSSNSNQYSLNNKVVTINNQDFYYIYGNMKHIVPANAASYMDVGPIIVLNDAASLDSFESSPRTQQHAKCNRDHMKSLWDDFATKVHSGEIDNKCVQAADQRNVYLIRNGSLHYINFQQFVGLGFDFADVIKLQWPTFEQLHIGDPLEGDGKIKRRRIRNRKM